MQPVLRDVDDDDALGVDGDVVGVRLDDGTLHARERPSRCSGVGRHDDAQRPGADAVGAPGELRAGVGAELQAAPLGPRAVLPLLDRDRRARMRRADGDGEAGAVAAVDPRRGGERHARAHGDGDLGGGGQPLDAVARVLHAVGGRRAREATRYVATPRASVTSGPTSAEAGRAGGLAAELHRRAGDAGQAHGERRRLAGGDRRRGRR